MLGYSAIAGSAIGSRGNMPGDVLASATSTLTFTTEAVRIIYAETVEHELSFVTSAEYVRRQTQAVIQPLAFFNTSSVYNFQQQNIVEPLVFASSVTNNFNISVDLDHFLNITTDLDTEFALLKVVPQTMLITSSASYTILRQRNSHAVLSFRQTHQFLPLNRNQSAVLALTTTANALPIYRLALTDSLVFTTTAIAKNLHQRPISNLVFTTTAIHNIKNISVTDNLVFVDEFGYNNTSIRDQATHNLTFNQSVGTNFVVASATNNLLLSQDVSWVGPKYHTVFNTLNFEQGVVLSYRVINWLACHTLYMDTKASPVREAEAENEITFTLEAMTPIVARLVFATSVTTNALYRACNFEAYIPDKTRENTMSFSGVASVAGSIKNRALSNTLNIQHGAFVRIQ